MAADFPATKKTFTQLVDGTDYTEATQVNQAYDEAEAIETFLGAMGRSQAYNTSIKAMMKNYKAGCKCVYKSATELTVTAGEIYIGDASGNGAYRQNTSDVTVTWAMIDTGSEANSTQYYVYARADSAATTFTVLISTNATTPTGGTYYRKIGRFYNDGSGNITLVNSIDQNQTSNTKTAIGIDSGTTGSIGAGTQTGQTVSFNFEFSAAPVVVICCYDSDNNLGIGGDSGWYITAITTTGFTFGHYNASQAVEYKWIAIGTPA